MHIAKHTSKFQSLLTCVLVSLLMIPGAAAAQHAAQPANEGPLVTYQDGQLTIRANHSSLRTILDAIHAATGAVIEAAGIEDRAPVVAYVGTGEPSKVIAELLYGTSWNYAVLGSADHPQKIDRIVVLPRSAAPIMAAAPPPPAAQPPADSVAASDASQEEAVAQADDAAGEEKKDDAESESAEKSEDDKAADDENAKSENAEDEDGKTKTADGKDKDDADKTKAEGEDDGAVADAAAEAPVFPTGMYDLYNRNLSSTPGGATGNVAGRSTTGAAPGGTGSPLSALMAAQYGLKPGSAPVTPAPVVVTGEFPPELWKLYPPNLMDLVKTPLQSVPQIVLPPPPGTVQAPGLLGGYWDQGVPTAPPGGG